MPSPVDYLHFQSKMQAKGVAIQRMDGDYGVIDKRGDPCKGIAGTLALTDQGVV